MSGPALGGELSYRRSDHEGEYGELYYQALVGDDVVGCAGVLHAFEGRAALESFLVAVGGDQARRIEDGLMDYLGRDLRRVGVKELAIEAGSLEELLRSERYRDRIGKDELGRVVLRLG